MYRNKFQTIKMNYDLHHLVNYEVQFGRVYNKGERSEVFKYKQLHSSLGLS